MRGRPLPFAVLSLAFACGGATSASDEASACDREATDDVSSGCITLTGADFAQSVIRVSNTTTRASGWLPVTGHGVADDGAVAEVVDLEIGTDQLAAEAQSMAFVDSTLNTAGVTTLQLTEYACTKPPPPPSRGPGQPNVGPCPEFSEQRKLARATGGTTTCDASPTRIACRFHDVPVRSSDGTELRASGWMHTPPPR